jgi:hypothetical protein
VPHRFVLSYVWMLPRLDDQTPVVRHLLGHWETSGIWNMQSGKPFSIYSGSDNALSGINRDYANLVGDPYLDSGRPRSELIQQYFNTSAYAPNPAGTFGTAPRNHLRGPGDFTADLSVMKIIPITERFRTQFRAEFFNLFNRPNFGNPYATQRVSSRFGHIESAGDARVIQFGLKLLF